MRITHEFMKMIGCLILGKHALSKQLRVVTRYKHYFLSENYLLSFGKVDPRYTFCYRTEEFPLNGVSMFGKFTKSNMCIILFSDKGNHLACLRIHFLNQSNRSGFDPWSRAQRLDNSSD